MHRQWRCTVCGYVHEGAEPPETCPVCGAARSRFVPLGSAEVGLLRDVVASFRLHPVAAHFPCGLLPTAALFLVLALFTGSAHLEFAVPCLLGVALAAVPVAAVSGLHDWRTRFGGVRAPVFRTKMALAAVLLLLLLSALALRLWAGGGVPRGLYVLLVLAAPAVAALLGHYGGKLAYSSSSDGGGRG